MQLSLNLNEIQILIAVAVGLFLLYEAYAKGRKSGHAKGKADAEQENQSLQGVLTRSQETVEELKSKVLELKGQLSEETEQLERLEAEKDQEIAKAIKTNKAELSAARAKLQADFDKAKHELEPKVRAEMEGEFKVKLEGVAEDFKVKQEGMEAEFKARHEKERATLWAFISVALDGDERLIQLFKVLPRNDALEVLMKAKRDKAMLKDLQVAAQLGPEHFAKIVETKAEILAQSSAGDEQPSSMDNDVLTLLKKGPLTHGQIVKATGKPKSSVSDSLKRLREGGLVEQDAKTEGYYAL